ncbi:hypothetical protein BJX64DRAFT_260011 [Aspergillus heterothallicus]
MSSLAIIFQVNLAAQLAMALQIPSTPSRNSRSDRQERENLKDQGSADKKANFPFEQPTSRQPLPLQKTTPTLKPLSPTRTRPLPSRKHHLSQNHIHTSAQTIHPLLTTTMKLQTTLALAALAAVATCQSTYTVATCVYPQDTNPDDLIALCANSGGEPCTALQAPMCILDESARETFDASCAEQFGAVPGVLAAHTYLEGSSEGELLEQCVPTARD